MESAFRKWMYISVLIRNFPPLSVRVNKHNVGKIMIKLKHSIPLALLSLAGASSPACADPKYDFALHGYIRSGIPANSDGNRADSVGLMPDGKWRLGNEEDTKIELIPTVTLTADSGVVAKVQANLTHQSKCTSDWNCQDDDGHDVQFREGFAELSNLDFAPEMTFWAGKRYSSSNTSSHQFDWEYIQYNGTGGGFDNMDPASPASTPGCTPFHPPMKPKPTRWIREIRATRMTILSTCG